MLKNAFSRVLVSLFVVLSIVSQGTLVLAGTTGTLSGTVIDSSTKQPLVGAKVTATSPSQIATATTDKTGHFDILSLAPDTYTLSIGFAGYETSAIPGVSIFADNTRDIVIPADKITKTIAIVKSKPANSLVKAGTTADVYSVDSTTQAKVAAAGGGTNLDSAFSALATVPGVVVAPGQSGYVGAAPALSIRGGDYDQIGYEIDGIPVNRSFDNYPSGPTSSLGQQELQVYTGAPPADSESEGISGYINQVIKTGTLPGFASSTVAVGGPAYYHKLNVELGGASADRRFSYYVGLGGYNQQYRYYDQYDGASLDSTFGEPLQFCQGFSQAVAPSCYTANGTPYGTTVNGMNGAVLAGGGLVGATSPFVLGPFDGNETSQVATRDNIVNLHYYFPHKDGSRDDLQALYEVNLIETAFYDSQNDLGGAAALAPISNGPLFGLAYNYEDGIQLNTQTGGFLPANYQSLASNYYFPNTPTHQVGGPIDPNQEDGLSNNQAIFKLQFTKSLGANAFARVYGYTYYSNYNYTGANSAIELDGGIPSDYELSSHTRGVNFAITDQINSQNLLNISGDYTTATTLRSNNGEFGDAGTAPSGSTVAAVVVDASNPGNGVCYTTTGIATNCFVGPGNSDFNGVGNSSLPATAVPAGYATYAQIQSGTVTPITGTTCGTGACQYLILGNGLNATYNTVKPNFYGASIGDEFRPNSKLTINAGIRLDDYQFQDGDTSGGLARQFYYKAYNAETCENPATQALYNKVGQLGLASASASCASADIPASPGVTAVNYQAVNFTNPAGVQTFTYPEFQPRIGATYSLDANTVLRASYGRFTQPPNSAYEQYNVLQPDAPAELYGTYNFQQYGFTAPDHAVPPAASNNYDFSVEHQFPHQVSIKLTPFYRQTSNQDESFFLNQLTGFVSGLNVGNQVSRGFEFELDKGNFSQQGLSAKLSFAYTNSYIKYNTLANGTTVLTPIKAAIQQYNSFTKAGGGAPCYTPTNPATGANGTPDPSCAAGDIANPYYNAPEQSFSAYENNATSIPYDLIPNGIGFDSTAIGAPFNTSLILNEKIGKVALTPVLQYFAGTRYGDPLTTNGINPATCAASLGASPVGDARYTYGSAGGSAYDASMCGALAGGIPNQSTGTFDGIGAFAAPSQILLNFQLSYEATKNFTLTANFANIVNTCFGGSKEPFTVPGACGYSVSAFGFEGATGNVYNPGNVIQPALAKAYNPVYSNQPFNVFVSGNFRI